jgi:OPT oligopeptide transporter protein
VGLSIGVPICFCNTYFGLQTGWGSGMSMPASLVGFAVFRCASTRLKLPFTPVENVLVQTVAGAAGTMSLGCGFVGVLPAIEFLLKRDEGGPISLGLGRLIIWSLGVCLFGSVFALALRKQVIIREKLRFPSGTATALLIGVLHGNVSDNSKHNLDSVVLVRDELHGLLQGDQNDRGEFAILEPSNIDDNAAQFTTQESPRPQDDSVNDVRDKNVWFLIYAFNISAFYVRNSSSNYASNTDSFNRQSSLISFLKYVACQSSVIPWQLTGCGP